MTIACQPDTNICESDNECQRPDALGDVCVQGTCQECIEDAQCVEARGDGYFCNSGRCDEKHKLSQLGEPCTEADECTTSLGCINGVCQDPTTISATITCHSTMDCATGFLCLNNICAEETPEQKERRKSCNTLFSKQDNLAREAILFEFNDYALTTNSQQQLQMAAECISEFDTLGIVLEGHSDDRGTQEYNLALGEKRATTVRNYLKTLGADPEKFVVRSKGENEPVCERADETCWARNRRVEFIGP